jgi:nucleoid-associated protein YgaU
MEIAFVLIAALLLGHALGVIPAERPAEPVERPAVVEPFVLQEVTTYTVRRGDSLWRIAAVVYGDPYSWRTIWEANRDLIPNPDVLPVGTVLTIPPKPAAPQPAAPAVPIK